MNRPEQALQRDVVRALHGLPVTFFHPANGGKRTKIEAAIFKGQGVRAGVPDLWIGQHGRTVFVELKSETGTVTKSQKTMHEELTYHGFPVAVCRTIGEVVDALRVAGFIK